MSKKRDKYEIIYDILITIQERGKSIKPTHILYKSNLSHQMLTAYLAEIKEKGFLIESSDRGKRMFILTEKGYKYIADYQSVRNLMESYGLE